MSTVPFWTPLNTKDRFTSMVDGCFSFGSKEAIVSADGKTAILSPKLYEETKWATAKRIIILMTGILPLIALIAKCVIRMTSKIECIDLTSTLSHGVKASQQSLDMIRSHMADLIDFNKEIKGITLIEDRCFEGYGNIAFELESAPDQIFEMKFQDNATNKPERIYNHSYRTQIICHQENLKLVALRGISKETIQFKGKSYTLLVKQKLPGEFSRSLDNSSLDNSETYFSKQSLLTETISEYTRFIMAAGYPYHWTYLTSETPPKLLLLEPVLSGRKGTKEELYSFASSLPESLCEIVIKTAQEKGISLEQTDIASKRTKRVLLLAYYEKNGIVKNPLKQIDINLTLNQLTLPWGSLKGKARGEPLEPVTAQDVAIAIIEEINTSIAERESISVPLSYRRSASISFHDSIWRTSSRKDLIRKGIKKWHPQILEALKLCGAIFNYQIRGQSIDIQA